jgi:hypothetical protein
VQKVKKKKINVTKCKKDQKSSEESKIPDFLKNSPAMSKKFRKVQKVKKSLEKSNSYPGLF